MCYARKACGILNSSDTALLEDSVFRRGGQPQSLPSLAQIRAQSMESPRIRTAAPLLRRPWRGGAVFTLEGRSLL